MAIWFEGTGVVDCDIDLVKQSFEDRGAHYAAVVSHMPGMISVELVEQGDDHITIRTNEGLMQRANISIRVDDDRVVAEFDEEYQAGSKVTARSHFVDEFVSADGGVINRLVVSDVVAPGLLGFLYRRFGSGKMGKAFLGSTRAHLES